MRALALFSGGLDSVLAMKTVIDQDIEVVAVHIDTGFGATKDRKTHMQNMCDQIGAKLEILDLKNEFLDEVLFKPKYGYGKNFNPCIDCHGFMFRYTSKLLDKYDASFMISGEVVGQRPMSQRRDSMSQVSSLSGGYDELILRPLSAKMLPMSKPEIEGWIDRDKLLDISGRGRKRQLQIAKEIGLSDFEPPAGGCLLTEENFSNRLKDFVSFDSFKIDDIDTLKFGRHLRLPNSSKLIVGRHKEDNDSLKAIKNDRYIPIKLIGVSGPYSLIDRNATIDEKQLASKIVLSYAKTENNTKYQLYIGEDIFEDEKFASKDEIQQYFIK
jgi:tRNA-specific 2-thiouridylase